MNLGARLVDNAGIATSDGAFLLLATDASAWMTGSTVAVDGGHLVSSL